MSIGIAAAAGLLLAFLFGKGRRGNSTVAINKAADQQGTWEAGVPNNDESAVEDQAATDEGLDVTTYEAETIILDDVPGDQPIIGPDALDSTYGHANVYREPGPPTIGSLAAFTALEPVKRTDPGAIPSDDIPIE